MSGAKETDLLEVVNEMQTNQAEHAAHLDQLAHRADLERAERAADRLLIRNNAEQVKECFDTIEAHRVWLRKIEQQAGAYSENTGAVLADIMGRVETLEVTANKATDLLAQYRRMVGNLFRRVADLVDGG